MDSLRHCLYNAWHMVGTQTVAAVVKLTLFAVARSMKGNETRQANGTATGGPDCPTGTPTRGAMSAEKDTARWASGACVGRFCISCSLSEYLTQQ